MKILSLDIDGADGLGYDRVDLEREQDGSFRLNNQPITAPEARQLWATLSKALHQGEDNERLKRNVEAAMK